MLSCAFCSETGDSYFAWNSAACHGMAGAHCLICTSQHIPRFCSRAQHSWPCLGNPLISLGPPEKCFYFRATPTFFWDFFFFKDTDKVFCLTVCDTEVFFKSPWDLKCSCVKFFCSVWWLRRWNWYNFCLYIWGWDQVGFVQLLPWSVLKLVWFKNSFWFGCCFSLMRVSYISQLYIPLFFFLVILLVVALP